MSTTLALAMVSAVIATSKAFSNLAWTPDWKLLGVFLTVPAIFAGCIGFAGLAGLPLAATDPLGSHNMKGIGRYLLICGLLCLAGIGGTVALFWLTE